MFIVSRPIWLSTKIIMLYMLYIDQEIPFLQNDSDENFCNPWHFSIADLPIPYSDGQTYNGGKEIVYNIQRVVLI